MIIIMNISWTNPRKCKIVFMSKLGWIISGKVSLTNDNEKENFMFAMVPASSGLPVNIHLTTTDRGSALFEPNIEELWNLEQVE